MKMTPSRRRKLGALGLLPDRVSIRRQMNDKSSAIDHGIKLPKSEYNYDDAERLKREMEYPSAWKIEKNQKEFRLKFDPKRVQEIHNAGVRGRKNDASNGILEKDNRG